MAKITLYQLENCPFCAKVRQKLDQKKLVYTKINVNRDREDPLRKEIAEKSGVLTIPVINVDGKWIGESKEIIAYLEQNFLSKD